MCRALPAAEVWSVLLWQGRSTSPRGALAARQRCTHSGPARPPSVRCCTRSTRRCGPTPRSKRSRWPSTIHQDGSGATSGALSGQLSALVHGPETVPSAWRAQLPVTSLMAQMVNDWPRIAEASWHVHDELADELWEKCPGY